jgi:hypothetical protein
MTPTRVKINWEATGPAIFRIDVRVEGNLKETSDFLNKTQVKNVVDRYRTQYPDNIIEVEPAFVL